MSDKTENIEIRLTILPDDEIFSLFKRAQKKEAITSNAQMARTSINKGLKQILNIQESQEGSA